MTYKKFLDTLGIKPKKKFSGRWYTIYKVFDRLGDAKYWVKNLRKTGYNARLVTKKYNEPIKLMDRQSGKIYNKNSFNQYIVYFK